MTKKLKHLKQLRDVIDEAVRDKIIWQAWKVIKDDVAVEYDIVYPGQIRNVAVDENMLPVLLDDLEKLHNINSESSDDDIIKIIDKIHKHLLIFYAPAMIERMEEKQCM